MSLIHTSELSKVEPFDYLVQLQRHAAELKTKLGTMDALQLPATRRPPSAAVPVRQPDQPLAS